MDKLIITVAFVLLFLAGFFTASIYYKKKMQTEFERGYLFGAEAHKNRMSLPGIDSIIIKGSDIQPWKSK